MTGSFPGRKKGCFIVAEISSNHGRDIDRAIAMISEAKRCGVDAVKFQAYTPDSITIDSDKKYFRIRHPRWGGQTLYQLYSKAFTPLCWLKKLKKVSESLGLVFFATAFDKTAVDLLEDLSVPFHKVASFESVDLPLIEYMARTKKPIILSTGMATVTEIKDAVNAAKRNGASDIALLKCVSSYPARPEEMNLRTIPDMVKRFGYPVGVSDHTLGMEVPIAAVSLGAVMIEKHFTLSRRFKTPDSFFSVEPKELSGIVSGVRTAEKALGRIYYGFTEDERDHRIFRRSLFAVRDIQKGEALTEDNIRSIRPAYGLKPKYLKTVLGKSASRYIGRGTPISGALIKQR